MTRPQQIRDEILLQLYGAGQRIGLTAEHMAHTSRRQGDDFSAAEFTEECLFVVGQGFAERIQAAATGEVRFRITSAGKLEFEANR